MRLSIVIPTWNAAQTLAAALAPLGHGDEIVVVDGGSTDGTLAEATRFGARLVEAPRGRGVQLRHGAGAARGDWLLFLHADTRLGQDWRAAVARHASRPGGADRAGVFRFAFDDESRAARFIELMVAARVRLLALPYGDQGLLIHRGLYERIGGYGSMPLMEDVDIVRRLGRARIAPLPVKATTSARRWREGGWARRVAINLGCLVLFYLGASSERIVKLYGR
ncbi:MAG: TIGR04283 family arsenosugar biosynthesis glycosyltransferase [Caulobacteraceae bacterium]